MRLVLDPNIYVDFARGRPDVVDLLATESTEILLPAIVMGELFYGFIKGSRTRYNEEKFHQFITTLDVSIILSALSNTGTRIPINDVWIAACCMSLGGTLLTRDSHFEHVGQIDKIILP
ncbi:PilT protein domain protein [uncultured Desulfobacterium sp.]|uniref:PilT protein domain protein n=1 Tax=uncultured Desulfobacterium sp. TaxID=201089 RepID=A0A445MUL0_9BACT|nr:PilT protein domain protein [uncultured Desulfobacterium sp.]